MMMGSFSLSVCFDFLKLIFPDGYSSHKYDLLFVWDLIEILDKAAPDLPT